MSKFSNYLLPKLTEWSYAKGLKEKLKKKLEKNKISENLQNNEINKDTEITIKRFVNDFYIHFKQHYRFSDKILSDFKCFMNSCKDITIPELCEAVTKISSALSSEDNQFIHGLLFSSSLCEVIKNTARTSDETLSRELSIEDRIMSLQKSVYIMRSNYFQSVDKFSLIDIFHCLTTSLYLLMYPCKKLGFIVGVEFLLQIHNKSDSMHRSDETFLIEVTREYASNLHSSNNLAADYESFKEQLMSMNPSGIFALIFGQSFLLFLFSSLSDQVINSGDNWNHLTSLIIRGRWSLSNSLEFFKNIIGIIGDVGLSKWICKDVRCETSDE